MVERLVPLVRTGLEGSELCRHSLSKREAIVVESESPRKAVPYKIPLSDSDLTPPSHSNYLAIVDSEGNILETIEERCRWTGWVPIKEVEAVQRRSFGDIGTFVRLSLSRLEGNPTIIYPSVADIPSINEMDKYVQDQEGKSLLYRLSGDVGFVKR